MTAAFVLAINMVIAAIFALAFGVVAATNRTAGGAGWVAAGYGAGVLNVVLEFALHWHTATLFFAIGIYVVYLVALTFCVFGLAAHYRVAPPRWAIGAIWTASLLAVPIIFTLPYGSVVRGVLYQLPYVAMQTLAACTILRSRRLHRLDLLLVALNGVVAATYLLKPAIATAVGTAPSPEGYMTSIYAAISQSIGSVTLVALALVLLLVMMRDTAREMQARAETDSLSGLFNRRGFDTHGERMLAEARRSGGPLTLVTADLDHFKAINDNFGHAAGDEVIVYSAALLRRLMPEGAIVSRLGGEEFAVLLPGADLAAGRRYAESVREALSARPAARLGRERVVTASFGVAQMAPDDSLLDLTERADAALYRAKAGGRNRVTLALSGLSLASAPAVSAPALLAAPKRRVGGWQRAGSKRAPPFGATVR